MNKSTKIVIVIIIIAGVLLGIFALSKNMNKSEENKNEVKEEDKEQNYIINQLNNYNSVGENLVENSTVEEIELSNFSTTLAGDNNRLENIRISCEALNEHIIKNGETFSFNDVVGQPTEEKGYKQADIIVGTKLEKGLGGGNCQVSTTLYNACLNVEGIEITERHPHKRKVTYVEEGKDASVSYGTLDLKFVNNTGNSIKILMNSEESKVTAKIMKV